MSAVADRSPTETTICPRCGAHLGADQDWCLECGAAVRVRVRSAPDWRVPVAIVGGVVAVAAAIVVFALSALSNSANSSVPAVLATAPVHHTRAHRHATASKTATTTPTTTPTTAATTTTTATIASWPAGVTGYTVVLGVIPAKSAATANARKIAAAGIPVGLLYSSDYSSMHPGDWIVFSGTYTSRSQADAAATGIQAKGQTGAYAFPVVPAG